MINELKESTDRQLNEIKEMTDEFNCTQKKNINTETETMKHN